MSTRSKQERRRSGWLKRYVLGLAVGPAAALYGVAALLVGRTFLPGLHGDSHTVAGASGRALAGGYLLGGAYLFVRFYLEKRLAAKRHAGFYALENLLLAGFVAALVYVLLHVGAAQ